MIGPCKGLRVACLGMMLALCCAIAGPAAAMEPQAASAEGTAGGNGEIGRPMGLADAVALAVARHPDIARALAELARSRAELGAAKSAWMPRLSYNASIGPNMLSGENGSGLNDNMPGPSVALNQLVWDFGRTNSEIRSASAAERQRAYELEVAADQLAETAALAFLDVKRFEALAEATDRQVASLMHLRDLIRYRAEAGISDQSDLMLADVRVEGARGDAIEARSSLTAARAALGNLTGLMPRGYADAAPVIDRFAPHVDAPDYMSLPAVNAAREAEEAAVARIAQARAERMPRLGLQLGYSRNNYTYNTRDNAFTALVTVTGDLYRADASSVIEAARHERRAAEAERQSTILEIRGRVLAAREQFAGARARIDAYRQQEARAVTTRDIFLEEYKLGKRSLPDLLSAEQEIYRAATARIGAEYDAMRARVQMETAYGTLRPALGLAAAVEQEEAGQ